MSILEVAWQEGTRMCVKGVQIDTWRCRTEKTAGTCHSATWCRLCHPRAGLLLPKEEPNGSRGKGSTRENGCKQAL